MSHLKFLESSWQTIALTLENGKEKNNYQLIRDSSSLLWKIGNHAQKKKKKSTELKKKVI